MYISDELPSGKVRESRRVEKQSGTHWTETPATHQQQRNLKLSQNQAFGGRKSLPDVGEDALNQDEYQGNR